MIRELFHIGSFSISPFGLMLMLAFLSAYWQVGRGLRHLGIGDEEDASAVLLWGGLGGIAGGKIYYAILYRDWHLLFDRSGLVWYGGFLLGTAAVIWCIRRRRLPAWETLDAMGPALALGYGVGRIGCFLVGDDYGKPTELPWGVAFPVGLPPSQAGWLRSEFGLEIPASIADDTLLTVHPTQLYETALALVIWLVGWRLLRRGLRPGATFLTVLPLLATERFVVEFFRAKDDRFLGGLTLAQGISVAILLVVAGFWMRRRSDGGVNEP